jgi:hypothetical protein
LILAFVSAIPMAVLGARRASGDPPPTQFTPDQTFIIDSKTGLAWDTANLSVSDLDGAVAFCKSLNNERSPTAKELLTVVDVRTTNPSKLPFLKLDPNTPTAWSVSEAVPAGLGEAYYVDYSTGLLERSAKNVKRNVLCVSK